MKEGSNKHYCMLTHSQRHVWYNLADHYHIASVCVHVSCIAYKHLRFILCLSWTQNIQISEARPSAIHMTMVSHRRQTHYEEVNIFSLIYFINCASQLWYDHITPEMAIYAFKSLRDLLFMGIELLIENTMIQVISLLKHHRTPLRDLVEEYLSNPNRTFVKLAYIGEHTYQVETNTVLFLWVFYCFLHGPNGLKVLQKGVRCLTISRALRVLTFSMTILPNPNTKCTFTGPIDPFNLSPGGACNDLLYSGHVIVYTISALAVTILCASYPFGFFRLLIRLFIWFQVIQRMIRAIVGLHHYSVDMFLGLCVTLLIWHSEILYYDLPCLPQPLYPHLKRLLCPYDDDGSVERYIDQLMFVYSRFKRQPIKTLMNLITSHAVFIPTEAHMKQI